jgi:hypothetical protein
MRLAAHCRAGLDDATKALLVEGRERRAIGRRRLDGLDDAACLADNAAFIEVVHVREELQIRQKAEGLHSVGEACGQATDYITAGNIERHAATTWHTHLRV